MKKLHRSKFMTDILVVEEMGNIIIFVIFCRFEQNTFTLSSAAQTFIRGLG